MDHNRTYRYLKIVPFYQVLCMDLKVKYVLLVEQGAEI